MSLVSTLKNMNIKLFFLYTFSYLNCNVSCVGQIFDMNAMGNGQFVHGSKNILY